MHVAANDSLLLESLIRHFEQHRAEIENDNHAQIVINAAREFSRLDRASFGVTLIAAFVYENAKHLEPDSPEAFTFFCENPHVMGLMLSAYKDAKRQVSRSN